MPIEFKNISGTGSFTLVNSSNAGSFVLLLSGSINPPPPTPVSPTAAPTVAPTTAPTPPPTTAPTAAPTTPPTPPPTIAPTASPTTAAPTTASPTAAPTNAPTVAPTAAPTTAAPTTAAPTPSPTPAPTQPPQPNDPTLQIWYDGADITQFQPSNPSNNTAITQWSDKSATAHNAAPIGGPGTRPLYQTNIQNGKSAVYFDQVEDGLEAPMTNALQNLTGSTLIWVGKTNSTSSNQQVVQGVDKAGSSYTSVNGQSLYISGSYGYVVAMASGSAFVSRSLDTNFHIHTLVFNGTQTGNSNRFKYRIDGIEQTLTFTTNVGTQTSAVIDAILLGTDANLNNDFLGHMGEVLLYTKTLNATEINNTETYLKSKWGIT